MEWIAELEGQTVGLDTAPLIYFIEEHPAYLESILFFLRRSKKAKFTDDVINLTAKKSIIFMDEAVFTTVSIIVVLQS